jgi:hypothetical protein
MSSLEKAVLCVDDDENTYVCRPGTNKVCSVGGCPQCLPSWYKGTDRQGACPVGPPGPVGPLDLAQMQTEVHALARAKGWYEDRDLSDPDVRESMLALIHSEVSEALECVRRGQLTTAYANSAGATFSRDMGAGSYTKPVGLPIELADIVIRVLVYCAAFGFKVRNVFLPSSGRRPSATRAGAWFSEMHDHVCKCDMSLLVSDVYRMASCYRIDLNEAIRLKHSYNATRPHRHGGKAL